VCLEVTTDDGKTPTHITPWQSREQVLQNIVNLASMLLQPVGKDGAIELVGAESFKSRLMLAAREYRTQP
jgi:hypothetical protein